MDAPKYRQYTLRSGKHEVVCWLQHGPALHVRRRLTLKGDPRVWEIVARHAPLLDEPPDKAWKVGGLL